MQNDIIDMVEETPKLYSKKCKLISLALKLFLQYFIYVVSLIAWYKYDYFVAITTLLFSYLVMGIVRSKIRNSVIPFKQREYQYSDKEIAVWFSAKEICNDELETKLEMIV